MEFSWRNLSAQNKDALHAVDMSFTSSPLIDRAVEVLHGYGYSEKQISSVQSLLKLTDCESRGLLCEIIVFEDEAVVRSMFDHFDEIREALIKPGTPAFDIITSSASSLS